jgi:glycosyltransferase involved in cell wall biosynthesis
MVQKHVSSGFFKNASQHVIPNSVASAQLQNQQPQNTSGSLRIGYLGRIHSTKGVEWLLNFIQPFLRDSVILQIAGEGEQQYFNSLQKKYSSDRVMFLGKQKSYSFLAGIDLLIVPSLWNEPLGRVVLEAYACGIPVAVSARGGLPELVIENETGCVFEPKEPHALETFIKKLQYDKSYYKKISLDVLKYADNFSKESIAKKYDKVYSNI